jgi:hypothetical protein
LPSLIANREFVAVVLDSVIDRFHPDVVTGVGRHVCGHDIIDTPVIISMERDIPDLGSTALELNIDVDILGTKGRPVDSDVRSLRPARRSVQACHRSCPSDDAKRIAITRGFAVGSLDPDKIIGPQTYGIGNLLIKAPVIGSAGGNAFQVGIARVTSGVSFED